MSSTLRPCIYLYLYFISFLSTMIALRTKTYLPFSKINRFRFQPLKMSLASRTTVPQFNENLASVLAAYSFESYNEPFVGKPAVGLDNTKVYFTSLKHIRNSFSGAVIVTFKRIKLINSGEMQLAERLVSGSNPDPYVIGAVYERYSENPLQNRVLDSVRSTTKHNAVEATWTGKGSLAGSPGESYALYLRDTEDATIEFSVFDEEVFSVDEFLGNAVLSFQELKAIMQRREDATGLPESKFLEDYDLLLPIYADQMRNTKKESMLDSMKAFITRKPTKERIRVGTLNVAVKYLPWNALTDEQLSNLVVLGDTNVLDSPQMGTAVTAAAEVDNDMNSRNSSNSNNNNTTENKVSQNKTSDWSNFLSRINTMKTQLPTIPLPAEVMQSVEANIRNRTSDAIQSLMSNMRSNNSSSNSTVTETNAHADGQATVKNHLPPSSATTAAEAEAVSPTLTTPDKNQLFQTAFLPRGGMPGADTWQRLLQRLLLKQREKQAYSTEESSWNNEEEKLLNGLLRQQMHQICSIDSPETDTQVAIWADMSAKSLIVSFRGTELVRVKDILTDINLFQAPFRPDHVSLSQAKVHQGFLRAYDSVQLALLQQVHDIFALDQRNNDNSDTDNKNAWTIYITGHSLGGALATLFAFDLARIRAGLYNQSALKPVYDENQSLFDNASSYMEHKWKTSKYVHHNLTAIPLQSQVKSDVFRIPRHVHFANSLVRADADAALIFLSNHTPNNIEKHNSSRSDNNSDNNATVDQKTHNKEGKSTLLKGLSTAELVVYTYGAPRVGDPVFKTHFDRLLSHCFRVVNRQDIVARMPRNVTLPFALTDPIITAKATANLTATTTSYTSAKTTSKASNATAAVSAAALKKEIQRLEKQKRKETQQSLRWESKDVKLAAKQAEQKAMYTLSFAHVGRTVLIDQTFVPPPLPPPLAVNNKNNNDVNSSSNSNKGSTTRPAGVWIEQESLAQCPLSQDGSFFLPTAEKSNSSSTTKNSQNANNNTRNTSNSNSKTAAAAAAGAFIADLMQQHLRPAVTAAMETASRNVNDMVEKRWQQLQQQQPLSSSAAQDSANNTTNSASDADWTKISEELIAKLRATTINNGNINSSTTDNTPSKSNSDRRGNSNSNWQLLEKTLSDWKNSSNHNNNNNNNNNNNKGKSSDDASSATDEQQQQEQQERERERWNQVLAVAAGLGVDTQFLSREVALLTSLWDRTAVEHHLEPAYFEAMCQVAGCEDLVVAKALAPTNSNNNNNNNHNDNK